jgi:hypothetical protein
MVNWATGGYIVKQKVVITKQEDMTGGFGAKTVIKNATSVSLRGFADKVQPYGNR